MVAQEVSLHFMLPRELSLSNLMLRMLNPTIRMLTLTNQMLTLDLTLTKGRSVSMWPHTKFKKMINNIKNAHNC